MSAPRGGVNVTGRAPSFGAGPESNGEQGFYSFRPYDRCAPSRAGLTVPGTAAAAAAAVAGLPPGVLFRLIFPVTGIAAAIAACWPDLPGWSS